MSDFPYGWSGLIISLFFEFLDLSNDIFVADKEFLVCMADDFGLNFVGFSKTLSNNDFLLLLGKEDRADSRTILVLSKLL